MPGALKKQSETISAEKPVQKNTAVVVLNYNNWQDTLLCVESILSGVELPRWLLVIDNASSDGSAQHFAQWAASRPNRHFTLDFSGVNVPFDAESLLENCEGVRVASAVPHIIFVHAATNRGYAAGNNLGIAMALHLGADAVWILNNDTIVDKNALAAMRERLFSKPRPGLCGSLVCYMEGARLVQCRAGGYTNKWTGLSAFDGNGLEPAVALEEDPVAVEKRINFICGASVMASREFIETVGLMDERYFLYCEEQDWAYSAKGRFDFAYAPGALVLHKEGATTGFSHTKLRVKSLWYLTRSRILLAWKHVPYALPSVCFTIFAAAARMLWRRLEIRKRGRSRRL